MSWTPRNGARMAVQQMGDNEGIRLLCNLLTGEVATRELDKEPWRGLLRDISGMDTRWVQESDLHAFWPRAWAARALCYVGDERATDSLIAATDDEHWRVRMNAVRALGIVGGTEAANAVFGASHDPHPRVRSAAATACGVISDDRAFSTLARLLEDPDGRVVARADAALERLTRSD